MLGPCREGPASTFQYRFIPVRFELLDFGSTDIIDRLADSLHDMKSVEDMNRMAGFFPNDFDVTLPHVAANELQLGGSIFSEESKEAK